MSKTEHNTPGFKVLFYCVFQFLKRRNPSGFAPVNHMSFFKFYATFYKSYLPKERWSDPDPSHIHTAVHPDHPGLAVEQKLLFHYLFHHLQHIAKTTNFMQNKKLMLQLKSSLQGPWRKIIIFTKHDLCFGKTRSFPHVWISKTLPCLSPYSGFANVFNVWRSNL